MATNQVDELTATTIGSMARAAGMTPGGCLGRAFTGNGTTACPDAAGILAEADAFAIDGVALPADFSRADLYIDCDGAVDGATGPH
ncbi:MAG: hypothetical protein ACRCT8_03535 [Lacipirellulaceae bacterium]